MPLSGTVDFFNGRSFWWAVRGNRVRLPRCQVPQVQAVVFPTGFEYIVETLDAGGRAP
jgi:hypothetical protein